MDDARKEALRNLGKLIASSKGQAEIDDLLDHDEDGTKKVQFFLHGIVDYLMKENEVTNEKAVEYLEIIGLTREDLASVTN